MDDFKAWYLSKGIWGNVLTVLVSLISGYHVIDAAQGALIVTDGPTLLVAGATFLTGCIGFYGRWTAKKQIKA